MALGNKWVCGRKLDLDNAIRYKARLVVKGYEQRYGIDFKETFVPVVNSRAVRFLLALAATLDLGIHQMNFKISFRNGARKGGIYGATRSVLRAI